MSEMARFIINKFKLAAGITSLFAALLFVIVRIPTQKKHRKVCQPHYNLSPVNDKMRESVRGTVLQHFPWAELSKFVPPSTALVVLDRRNEAVFKQGYFVIGFDNFDVNTSVPRGYDFYVKYSSDHLGSHFYLKPNAIRLGIHGCKPHVKFIYRDNDVVLQPWVKDGFIKSRITFQQEFHNLSSNAGFVMSASSYKAKQMMNLWEAGAGLAGNIEQDQTVFRALFQENDKQFFSAVPNFYAVHIYSGVVNRERALATLRLKNSTSFQMLKVFFLCCLAYCAIQHLAFVLRYSKQRDEEISLMAKVLLRMGPGCFLMAAGLFAIVGLLANNPLQLGASLGIPVRTQLRSFKNGYQLAAGFRARVRVWSEEDALVIGDDKIAFKVRHAKIFNPTSVGEGLDIVRIVLERIPGHLLFAIVIVGKVVSKCAKALRLLDADALYLSLINGNGRIAKDFRKQSFSIAI